MIKRMLPGLVGVAVFGMAHASDWIDTGVFGTSTHGKYFLDRQSVRKQADGTKTVWFRVDYPTPQNMRNHTFRFVKTEARFNCSGHQIAVGPVVAYGETGNVVHQDMRFAPMEDPIPDSIGDELIKVVCAMP